MPLPEGWEDVELPDWEYFDRPPWGEEPPWRSRQDYRELPYDLVFDDVQTGREVATSSSFARPWWQVLFDDFLFDGGFREGWNWEWPSRWDDEPPADPALVSRKGVNADGRRGRKCHRREGRKSGPSTTL